jgi:hypothetical protein
VPSCRFLGGHGQFSHAFGGEVFDFYSVSLECFGYTLVYKIAQGFDINVVYIVNEADRFSCK